MGLKSFSHPITKAFAFADEKTIMLKAAFVDLCSDVDRYFRVTFNVNIYEKVNTTDFYKIRSIFLILKNLI